MSTTHTARGSDTSTGARPTGQLVYSALTGLTTLGVVLQALWAGIFLEHDGHRSDHWINVHARGAEVTIGLSILALVAAVVWLRHRKDLLVATAVLVVALIVEAYIGGRITDDGNDSLTAVHVPLAMLVLALAVWLPLRVRSTAARS